MMAILARLAALVLEHWLTRYTAGRIAERDLESFRKMMRRRGLLRVKERRDAVDQVGRVEDLWK